MYALSFACMLLVVLDIVGYHKLSRGWFVFCCAVVVMPPLKDFIYTAWLYGVWRLLTSF